MVEKKYKSVSQTQRKNITKKIKKALKKEEGLSFAYIFGSFVSKKDKIRDLDVAVYFNSKVNDTFKKQLSLGSKLDELINFVLPVDLVILNDAPLHFKYKILKTGEPVVINQFIKMADFKEKVFKNYIDIKPLRERAIKESIT